MQAHNSEIYAMINGISHHRERHSIMYLLMEEYITTQYLVQTNQVNLSIIQVPQGYEEHVKGSHMNVVHQTKSVEHSIE